MCSDLEKEKKKKEGKKKRKKNSVVGKLMSFSATAEFCGSHAKRQVHPAQTSAHDSPNLSEHLQTEKRILNNVSEFSIFPTSPKSPENRCQTLSYHHEKDP